MTRSLIRLHILLGLVLGLNSHAADITEAVDAIEEQVIEWRRDLHAHPELSNREFRTAAIVADHLKGLGLEVHTNIAHTGVVGVLKGGNPGPVLALRADMDALPVTERVDLPFASTVTAEFNGEEVGVMHACGHDTHVSMLMGAASILAEKREELAGTIVFVFQPAEEGAPEGEEGGAELMIKEGVLDDHSVDAIFGIHIAAQMPFGMIGYRTGGIMASVDDFRITVTGKQTHGSRPWSGVDPIVTSAQIINALQTIVSREMELTDNAAVVSVGKIRSGVRSNIIPESAELVGTIRALDPGMRLRIHESIRRKAELIAQSMGATANVEIPMSTSYPVTVNDRELTESLLPALRRAAGADAVIQIPAITGAEDFSFFAEKVPGTFVFLGAAAPGTDHLAAPAHHTPDFFIDEGSLRVGVTAFVEVAMDFLGSR